MSNRAWVTLATNDSYSLGALVLAHSLRRAGSAHPSVVLITPSVTDAMKERLSAVFAEVIIVDLLDSRDAAHLALLQRPELGITFTKIHCWNLTQYEKCVFLDADTLVVQNCDELFEREELSAAPDVGWPDCFNSGVFVFRPSADTFSRLITFAQERGSFDGGDQGLLNSFFSDWAHGDISKHLPFLYNVTSAAFYSYIPALKHYGRNLKIIHFIGAAKPWLQQYNWDSNTVESPDHIRGLLQLWWDIFVGQVHTQLDTTMVEVEEEPEEATPEVPPQDVLFYYAPKLDPESEFPWHHPAAQIPKDLEVDNKLDPDHFYDPWEHYKGSMPENNQHTWSQNEPKINIWESAQQEIQYSQPDQTFSHREYSQHDERQSQNPETSHWQHSNPFDSLITHNKEQNIHTHTEHHYQGNQEVQTQNHFSDLNHRHSRHSHDHDQNSPESEQHIFHHHENHHHPSNAEQNEPSPNNPYTDCNSKHEDNEHHQNEHIASSESYSTFIAHLKQRKPQYVYCVHLDHNKPRKQRQNKLQRVEVTVTQEMMNSHDVFDAESKDFDDVIPRHPYDGFYLRHRVTIDSCGKKVCTHEIPPTPLPSASPPPDRLNPSDNPKFSQEDNEASDETTPSNVIQDQTGVAGNLARVIAGATSTQREAIDELARRQGWEAGNIDYMGADSFDNIWAKISQTLNQPKTSPPRESPPKQPSPPKDQLEQAVPEVQSSESKEPDAPAVEVAQEAIPIIATTPDAASQETKLAPTSQEENQGEVLSTETVTVPVEVTSSVVDESQAPVEALTETPDLTAGSKTLENVPAPVATVEAPVVLSQALKTEAAPVTSEQTAVPPTLEPSAVPPTESSKVISIQALSKATESLASTKPEVIESTVESKIKAEVDSPAPKPEPVECKKTEVPAVPPTPPVTPKSTPESSTPVSEEAPILEPSSVKAAESAPAEISKAEPASEGKVAKEESAGAQQATDSPPLANTPSKEEAPSAPAAKSEEKRRPVGKLRLSPGVPPEPQPTPDSELEDAAALAHAIIAAELRTPTVTSPTPPASSPASPPLAAPAAAPSLAPQEPDVPTPPVGAVSLAQIGVKSKSKPTTADAIESSLTETKPSPVAETPKKKVVKKVVKKEGGAAGGEAPVPPPRKKEKKPKDK